MVQYSTLGWLQGQKFHLGIQHFRYRIKNTLISCSIHHSEIRIHILPLQLFPFIRFNQSWFLRKGEGQLVPHKYK